MMTNGKCFYCNIELLPFGNKKTSFTIDHIIPLCNGGTNELINLVPSCLSCNCRKKDR